MQTKEPKQVTLVITSCNRWDLLEKTLRSFYAMNDYPIRETIIFEDGRMIPESFREKFKHHRIKWLHSDVNVGQVVAIDTLYQNVKTEYVFHCEDDWQFIRPGFIQDSMKILEADEGRKIVTVWLRGLNYGRIMHPLEQGEKIIGGVACKYLQLNYAKTWHGFTWNPGLRRMSDYNLAAPFSKIAEFNPEIAHTAEAKVGQFYHSFGYRAVTLFETYVKHIGDGRHVGPAKKNRTIIKNQKHKMKKTLTEIGRKHNTDKATYHLFTDFYEQEFNKRNFVPKRILEIGIKDGASLRMWKEFFPEADVVGVDITLPKKQTPNGVSWIQGNAYSKDVLDYLEDDCRRNGKFDLVIDDGSHIWSHQIFFLENYQKFVSQNGAMILEDLHTSFTEGEYKDCEEPPFNAVMEILNLGVKGNVFFRIKDVKTDSITSIFWNR